MMKRKGTVLLVLTLVGCMGGGARPPDWVKTSTPVFLKENAFYGVGEASGIRNQILAKMTAESRARTLIEQKVDAYAVALMQAYKKSLSPDQLKRIEETQNLAFTFRTYVVMAMFDATVNHSWTDTEKDSVHVLVKLRLKRFTEKILDAEQADPQLRRFVRDNAQSVFDQLMKQEENG